MFRKLIIATPATTTLLAAVAVKPSKKGEPATPAPPPAAEVDEFAHYKCKLNDLPLYAPLHSLDKPKRHDHQCKKSALRENIEVGVRAVRVEVQAGYKFYESQKEQLDQFIETGKAHTAASIDYLNQPHNILPRSGAIAIGGLAGFIFAARGGFIKKVLYTTAGAGAIASLCYPRQAEQFGRDALYQARKAFAISYNFVKGVKPGDEVPVEPINKFPTSFEDIKFLMWDLYDETKEAIFGKKQ